MVDVPEQYRDLLGGPVLVSLATILPNGQPQVTPVWCDFDGTYVRVNTAKGRQKHKDMVARPQVTVLGFDPKTPFRYIEVRGTVTRIEEEGADAHIDKLAKDYTGADRYPNHTATETRVICYIEPTHIVLQG